VFVVQNGGLISYGELLLRIQHAALKEEKDFKRLQREIQAWENLPSADAARRGRIPDEIQLFVWQRDEGKCVRCGGNLNLEFDHIIPVAEGGSSTARNIQLLCETCNRQKGKSI
jgi:HNH endonuclease